MSDAPFNAVPDDIDESREIASLVDVEPEDFDFDAFVAGARGARRAVRICPSGDLLGEVDLLIEQAGRPDLSEDEAADILAGIDDTRSRVRAASRIFVVEGRSAVRRVEAHRQAGKAPDQKASPERHVRYAMQCKLLELADAIITPSGVTADRLRDLYETCPGEIDKLWAAFELACVGKGAPMLDF